VLTAQSKSSEPENENGQQMEMGTETKKSIALEFRNVSLSFDEKKVLNDINLKLGRGEMIFVTGLSGSGKSLLLRLAMGLEQPDSGQILIEGNDLGLLDENELLNLRGNRMGIVFQEDSLFTGLTAYDNVAFRLDEHGVSQAETDKAVQEVLQFVGLEKDAEKLPEELSGGMRRRLEIARALVGWPSIMLFDEPASGLDPLTASQVLDLIIRARDIFGISSLYVTKKLDEMPYLATHRAQRSAAGVAIEEATSGLTAPQTSVIVLERGRIIFTGSVAEFEASTLPAVTLLTDIQNRMPMSNFVASNPW
jgi:phospholipid/cholesterol/gamma-HCH transport system ATP-binding protein